MLKSRVQYIMTWVTFGLLLSSGTGLLVLSWNHSPDGKPSPAIFIVLWLIMSASGINLFMLAVKKAHRLWIDDERRLKEEQELRKKESLRMDKSSQDHQKLDIKASARKLVRRIPEDEPLSRSGGKILKNLSKELEIMSGVMYIREKSSFRASATFAISSMTEKYSFKEGEGLCGQVAVNQQIMVLTQLPEGYLQVYSGLGKTEPSYLAIVPLVHEGSTLAVLEFSGYRYDPQDIETMLRIFARELMDKLSPHLK